jgi:hypothetical protein
MANAVLLIWISLAVDRVELPEFAAIANIDFYLTVPKTLFSPTTTFSWRFFGMESPNLGSDAIYKKQQTKKRKKKLCFVCHLLFIFISSNKLNRRKIKIK